MAAQSFLNLAVSSNARTNWITIALGVVFGLLSFFKIIPDRATVGAWTSVFAVVLNLYNTISHLFKKE